ncbi:substrate-binding periplasmic protein [Fervidobacterium thailandense]|uniref:ABC transporter substrate-binding protein n=1 Tax=Fervidobacterium thailandense TaxID=1008305 RepID=A0A1E3G2S6_9BACT|nr:transporter substrate-binding domain-containing protein [Fervidobacterium thailandense]ODN30601.1 ABC transporter substrate-binding protein [Fervidobacterium thailandense]
MLPKIIILRYRLIILLAAFLFNTLAFSTTVLYTYAQHMRPKYFLKSGKIAGFCHDILLALNEELRSEGIEIRYKNDALMATTEILNALERNEIQIFVGLGYSDSYGRRFNFVKTPLYGMREVFLIRISQHESIYSQRIVNVGVLKGTVPSARVKEVFEGLRLVQFDNIDDAIKALDKGQIDTIYGGALVLGSYVKDNPKKYQLLGVFTDKFYHYVVVNRTVDTNVVTKLERAIKRIHEKRVIEKIIKKNNLGDFVLPGNVVEILLIDWRPYEWYDKVEKRWKGVDVDVVSSVFKKLGFVTEFVSFPWERCLQAMRALAYDGIMSLRKSREREEFLVFPDEPLSTGVDLLFKMKNKQLDISRLENIPEDVVCGYTLGYAYGDWFWNAKFKKEAVATDELGFRMLKRGKIDLFICNLLVAKHLLRELRMENEVEHSKNFGEVMIYHIAFSKNYHGQYLASLFGPELRKFKKTTEYSKILQRYGLKYEDFWSSFVY